MYCVKCGRQGLKGEKRCPDCGMKLVTPAKLKELIELERITNMTLYGRLRNALKRFRKRWRRRLGAAGDALGTFFSKLSVDFRAFLTLAGRLLKAIGRTLIEFAGKAWFFLKKYAAIGFRHLKRYVRLARKAVSQKAEELRQQYRTEKELQQKLQRNRNTEVKARATSTIRVSATGSQTFRSPSSKTGHKAQNTAPRLAAYGSTSKIRKEQNLYASPGRMVAHGSKTKNAKKRNSKRTTGLRNVFTAEWAQEHLRSLIALGLLLLALIIFAFWGSFSDSGQKTLAQIGLGSAVGYRLIGDDYMNENNYSRAVEYYYTSLTKELNYEAALKLAIAYSYTGDISKEISALLICTENYPQYKQPFSQLYRLYPEGSERPLRVQKAIEEGLSRYGSL